MSAEPRGRILHVEDEPAVRNAMAVLLSSEGYSVTSAASGIEAIDLVADGLRPDLLIVDFSLDQEMDGAEAAEALRRTLGYALPVIMLTGDPSSAELPWITDAPVWLAHKPINAPVLLATLPSLIQLSRSVRKLPRSSLA